LPKPRPAITSQPFQSPGGGNCEGRALARQPPSASVSASLAASELSRDMVDYLCSRRHRCAFFVQATQCHHHRAARIRERRKGAEHGCLHLGKCRAVRQDRNVAVNRDRSQQWRAARMIVERASSPISPVTRAIASSVRVNCPGNIVPTDLTAFAGELANHRENPCEKALRATPVLPQNLKSSKMNARNACKH
jgi:hypothetical protein